MRLLLQNIHLLVQTENGNAYRQRVPGKDMAHLPCISNAWLLTENDRILDFGAMSGMPEMHADTTIDCTGRIVLPSWCDSHTHLVFATTREQEFVDKIKGLSYAEIAAKGGGILNSAARLREADEDYLYEQTLKRLHEVMATGTGAIEIKSGYGLNTEAELKMLRVIRRIKENTAVPVKASLLAAHAYPLEYKGRETEYMDLIIHEIIPRVADLGLADYIDAFCEEGFFDVDATSRILEAAAKYGMKPKIHANQLKVSGGVQVGVRHNAISVDHLEHITGAEVEALQNSTTIPTLLPGAAFFLQMQYQPARMLLEADLPVCLASDYNPGSCPSGNIPLLLTIACTQLRMTPEEAIHSVTLNGAAAMEIQDEYGSIAKGKKANLIITKPMRSVALIPYDYGNNPVERIIINGKLS